MIFHCMDMLMVWPICVYIYICNADLMRVVRTRTGSLAMNILATKVRR